MDSAEMTPEQIEKVLAQHEQQKQVEQQKAVKQCWAEIQKTLEKYNAQFNQDIAWANGQLQPRLTVSINAN